MKHILLLLTLIITVACSAKSNAVYPDWFYKPSGDGYTGGIGISGTHFLGKTAQRELAISRAIDDISRQLGIDVNNKIVVSSTNTETNINAYSIQSVNGQKFRAKIVEIWLHPTTNEMYVYMVSQTE